MLQYSSHRPYNKPYNSARSQKPTSLRLKPRTGVVEVDVPILTYENYNVKKGAQFGKAMSETRISHTNSGYGLSGGFVAGQGNTNNVHLHDVPLHDEEEDKLLDTQTLGAKAVSTSDRDPVYMLGSLRGNEIHLTHLDAVLQLRPQLHHLDAEEELLQKREQSKKVKGSSDAQATKLETKAIEMKIKDSKEDAKDRNLNTNTKLLRDIQSEPWRNHTWAEGVNDDGFRTPIDRMNTLFPVGSDGKRDKSSIPQLKSLVDNDEWLDRMSSPGIELRARLKGRDRERARRKRQERLRLSKSDANATADTGTAPFVEGSGTESSSDGEPADVGDSTQTDTAQIKEEPDISTGAASKSSTNKTVAESTPTTAKKRGRPKKTVPPPAIDGDG